MIRGKRWGSRKPRIVLAGAIAAVTAMALAGTAQATTTPVAMTFDHGLVKLGGSGTPIDVVANGGPFPTFTADVCTDTTGGCAAVGDFTITIANFVFPPATSDVSGVPGETATFGLIPLANVTGHYDAATGVLTTNSSNYRSNVTLAGPITAACKVTPIPLAFSTAKTTPFQGDAFDAASSPPVNGVIDADWSTLPTPSGITPADDCDLFIGAERVHHGRRRHRARQRHRAGAERPPAPFGWWHGDSASGGGADEEEVQEGQEGQRFGRQEVEVQEEEEEVGRFF